MKQILQYTLLAVILVGLGWTAYNHLNSEPEPEPERPTLQVGDAQSKIHAIYGKAVGVSEKSGITTHFFEGAEVDTQAGTVVAIRDQSGVSGTLKIGERKVVLGEGKQIDER